MLTRTPLVVIALFITVASDTSLAATTKDQGAVIVRVPDGTSPVCINANTHKISFILRKVIVTKDVGFFKEDKEVGLKLDVQMAGNTDDDQKTQKFPRMFKTSIEEFDKGSVTLPIEKIIFHGYKLKSDNTITTQIETEFSILKKKKKAPFSIALEQLSKTTSSLPIPPNPYVTAFNHFATYADEVVSKSITEENNVSEELKGGNIAFAFSEDGNCSGTLEKTGTLAVVKAANGTEDDGIINTSKEYCYAAQFTPTFELKFADVPADLDCNKATNFKKIKNPYLGFILNASTVGTKSFGGGSAADKDAQNRCKIHGLNMESCL